MLMLSRGKLQALNIAAGSRDPSLGVRAHAQAQAGQAPAGDGAPGAEVLCSILEGLGHEQRCSEVFARNAAIGEVSANHWVHRQQMLIADAAVNPGRAVL